MSKDPEKPVIVQTLIPALTVDDAVRAIDFYKKAFGAEETMRMPGPDGKKIMHAEIRIGDSVLFLSDEVCEAGPKAPKDLGGVTGSIYLAVDDVDSVFNRALEAGAREEMAVEDMFWGDRMGSLVDPFGHHWAIATHKEDVPPEELERRTDEFYKEMAAKKESEAKASV